jgi:hypothetical protein
LLWLIRKIDYVMSTKIGIPDPCSTTGTGSIAYRIITRAIGKDCPRLWIIAA